MRRKIGIIFLILSTYLLISILPFRENLGGSFGEILKKFLFRELGKIYSFTIVIIFVFFSIFLISQKFKKFFFTFSLYLILLPFGLNFIFENLIEKSSKTFLLYKKSRELFNIFPATLIFFLLLFPIMIFIKNLKAKKVKKITHEKIREKKINEKKVDKKREKKEEYYSIKFEKEELFKIFKTEELKSEIKKQELEEEAKKIKEKLEEFGIKGEIKEIHPGPFITLYEFEPEKGIQIKKIKNLSEDIALRMKSSRVRVVTPLPDKGTVGIEIPNKKTAILRIGNLINSKNFVKTGTLTIPLGVTTDGDPYFTDLTKMPHLLIAGATGSGKSVFIASIIVSIILKADPEEVKLILLDPKRVELSRFEGIPYLLTNVINDSKKATTILKLATNWMEERYKVFAKEGVRDIEGYNKKVKKKMPFIIIIIDEFADLMLQERSKIEYYITRLAQMARAVGIHLIIATQRPSVDVITGTIKANFPVRVSFRLPTIIDSRTILDISGAEKLLGSGDMLFIPPGKGEPIRLHGALISDEEIDELVKRISIPYFIKRFYEITEKKINEEKANILYEKGYIPFITGQRSEAIEEVKEKLYDILSAYFNNSEEFEENLSLLNENYYEKPEGITFLSDEEGVETIDVEGFKVDSLIKEAAIIVVSNKKASATLLQRKLNIGFPRAAKIIDQLEKLGIVGPSEGSKPRKVLVTMEELSKIFRE
ncbi:MAG: DNA translocase FtsK [Candidatus Hydrothermales bacterium]